MPARHFRAVSALLFASAFLIASGISAQTSAPPTATSPASPPAVDTSGQLRSIGGSVSSPIVIHQVDAQFSDAARKQKTGGTVLVTMIVDQQGIPQSVHVLRGVGYGLDENAVEAVRQYRFKPAIENGQPVAVQLNVEVNFRSDPTTPEPYESDPKFIAAITEGKKLTGTGELNFAADAYRKANKIAGGKCMVCLDNAIDLDVKMRDYKAAAKDTSELVAISVTAPDKSMAEGLRARVLYLQAGDKPKPEQLQAIHDLLQTALADYPKNVSARFLDGTVLARLGQTDTARQQFETCIGECAPTDPYLVRAKHFAANPALSYAKMAPAFTVTALDGSKFTLDEMGGRVVLIDFWATWCGPCNEELPHMKKIAKEFAGQPLVIISVSWDSDAAKWQDFIKKNEMTWVQYRDADHNLSKQFGVEAIPHYFTIDSDGVLTSEMLGSGSDVEGKLRKLVTKAKATQTNSISASLAAPAN